MAQLEVHGHGLVVLLLEAEQGGQSSLQGRVFGVNQKLFDEDVDDRGHVVEIRRPVPDETEEVVLAAFPRLHAADQHHLVVLPFQLDLDQNNDITVGNYGATSKTPNKKVIE